MSVKDVLLGSGTGTKNEIDVIDIGALVALPFVAGLIFQVWTWQIDVFGTWDLTQPLWTIAGADISIALLLGVFSLLWIGGTNLANAKTEMDEYAYGALVLALALPILVVFVPSVKNLVMWSPLMQLAAWLYVSAAAVYVSYVG